MFNAWNKIKGFLNTKLSSYTISTNDSKFDNVSQIIEFKDSKPYLITNIPTTDNNYIQKGRRHTVLGMEFSNQQYGYQVSFGSQKILYRTKDNNVWSQWQCLTQNQQEPNMKQGE